VGELNPWVAIAAGLSVAGVAIAIIANTDTATALTAGTLAVAGAALVGVLIFQDRVRRRITFTGGPSGAPMVALAGAFRAGTLGRMSIIGTIGSLERRLPSGETRRILPTEERRLMGEPNDVFQAWVGERLSRLEKET
jgi:hypothetical protein